MNLEQELNEAAFWHEWVCLGCGVRAEHRNDECEDCGGTFAEAIPLLEFIKKLTAQREER